MHKKELDVEHVFMQAMKAGDQYGTGVVVMMIDGQMPEDPLDIRRVREGDISALHYFDRYDSIRDASGTMIYPPPTGAARFTMKSTHPMLVRHFECIIAV